jgi:general stress protein 26
MLADPITDLDPTFSSADAVATPWSTGLARLTDAQVYWLTTVRPDGHPHVTPLLAVWLDDALHFCTGAGERKAKNLAVNPNCILTAGTNAHTEGLDVVVEGTAIEVGDDQTLTRLAAGWRSKYDWRFDVVDGHFVGGDNVALVFRVEPVVAFGFAKGEPFGQTRWRF